MATPTARPGAAPPRPDRDRGGWGDARLRAELKAVLVSPCVPVYVRSFVCVYACARGGGGGLGGEGRGKKQAGKEEEIEKK